MNAIKRSLIYYTCQCCKESYSDKEDAGKCCSGMHIDEQEAIWERRLDLAHTSISVCPHH